MADHNINTNKNTNNDEYGSVEEPALKKIKITPLDEPLKKSDFIHFQKDCLYRTIQDYRLKYNSLNVQYDNVVSENSNVIEKFAILTSVYDIFQNYKEEGASLLDLSEAELKEKLQVYLATTTTTTTTQTSGLAVNDDVLNLKQTRDSLLIKNKQLKKDLETLKQYYESVVHKFERNSSDILKRVFKIDEADLVNKLENGESIGATVKNENNDNGDKDATGSIKSSVSLSTDVNNNDKNNKNNNVNDTVTTLENSHNSNTSTAMSSSGENNNTEQQQQKNTQISKETEIVNKVEDIKSDLELQECKDKIELLEQKIENLNKSFIENQDLLNKSEKINLNQNKEIGENKHIIDTLNNKLENLTKNNNLLISENSQFLNKFNSLYQDRSETDLKNFNKFVELQEKLHSDVLNMEKDLVRIRNQRDSIQTKLNISQADKKNSDTIKELELIISKIEEKLANLEKFHNLSQSNDDNILMNELQELESAYKELSSEALKKIDGYLKRDALLVSKLSTEKARADEKYYAAMRSKESIIQENKNLLKTLTKTNELNTQLKESEKIINLKLDNLSKQLNLSRENEKRLVDLNKQSSKKISELTLDHTSSVSKYNKTVQENNVLKQENLKLVADLKVKTDGLGELEIKSAQLEKKYNKLFNSLQKISENPKLLLQQGQQNGGPGSTNKASYNYGSKSQNELMEELDNFRTIVYCSLCSKNWKNTTLKNCGHVFCEECCQERLNARMRKCPSCTKPFSANDLLTIHL